jgi:hypothetical protein
MKAERRHELKANSLSQGLKVVPDKIKQYQSQISLGIILIALVIILIRYRINAAGQRLLEAQISLSNASDDLQRLENARTTDPQVLMKEREDIYAEGLQQADDAFQKAPDWQRALKAQALILKGDLNFNMANFPELPGAATQTSLRPSETEDTLLSNAADAYSQVLQNYASEKFAATAAHFGLGAVAENRGQWDAAKTQYQAIVDSGAEQPYKLLATDRLALIPQLSQPLTMDLPATQPAAVLGPSVKLPMNPLGNSPATPATKPVEANSPGKR